jgi:hypothetical protein
MSGRSWGIACVAAGLSMAYGGWRLVKSQEHPAGTAGFEGPGLNRRGWLMMTGDALLALGLILAIIVSSFFFIGGR